MQKANFFCDHSNFFCLFSHLLICCSVVRCKPMLIQVQEMTRVGTMCLSHMYASAMKTVWKDKFYLSFSCLWYCSSLDVPMTAVACCLICVSVAAVVTFATGRSIVSVDGDELPPSASNDRDED